MIAGPATLSSGPFAVWNTGTLTGWQLAMD